MANSVPNLRTPDNEKVLGYGPGSPERASLENELEELRSAEIEIAPVIGGREIKTGRMAECTEPHDHDHVLGKYHKAGAEEVEAAIAAARAAHPEWSAMRWEDRAAVFMKAADLLAGPRRDELNAATMLCQSKNAFQAEIDSACELIDFFRFNAHYYSRILQDQPYSPGGMWNSVEYRPLEGFVLAVTPFNFTSIAGNLPTAPAIAGNTVLWKPASSAVYSAHYVMKLLKEAGLPDGVINFLPGPGGEVGGPALASPDLAGVHFTGSTGTFQHIWRTIGSNIERYKAYPRIVGETGGKDFIFVHESAPVYEAATALVRGAFEYQGQKCSAASRAYIPATMWDDVRARIEAACEEIRMGSPRDFGNFMNAVIDKAAFASITEYIAFAQASPDAEVVIGGGSDDSKGWFIEPTVIVAKTPDFRTMQEEIFGPALTVYVYDPSEFAETLALCDRTSPYALTGAIFAADRGAVVQAKKALTHAAGNFYINDKPTGAVVGQQPFGGGRASGTNDKAGSALNLMRWISPRTIKETFVPPTDYRYPFMEP